MKRRLIKFGWGLLFVLVPLLAARFAFFLTTNTSLSRLESLIYDSRSASTAPLDPDARIQIIEINEKTFAKLGIPKDPALLNPKLAELVRALEAAGSPVIVFYSGALSGLKKDDPLAIALENPKITPIVTLEQEPSSAIEPPEERQVGVSFTMPGDLSAFGEVILAHQLFPENVDASKCYLSVKDLKSVGINSGVYTEEMPTPHVGVVALGVLTNMDLSGFTVDVPTSHLVNGGQRWPFTGSAELQVRWPTKGKHYQTTELTEALAKLSKQEGRKQFKGSAVILSRNFDPSLDKVKSAIGDITVAEYNACVTNTLLGGCIDRLGQYWNLFWLASLFASVFLLGFKSRHTNVLASIALGFIVAWFVPRFALSELNVYITAVPPIVVVLMAAVLSLLTFGLRVPQGQKEGTVLFIDLKDSTSLMESIGIERYIPLQTKFIQELRTIIEAEKGTVLKTQGDGLLALFLPNREESHAVRAVRAIQTLIKKSEDWGSAWGPIPGATIRFTAGVESGAITPVSGIVGGQSIADVGGPTVVLAARFQSACKELNVSIVLGPGTIAGVRHQFKTRTLGVIDVKGFADSIQVSTLADDAPRGSLPDH